MTMINCNNTNHRNDKRPSNDITYKLMEVASIFPSAEKDQNPNQNEANDQTMICQALLLGLSHSPRELMAPAGDH